MREQRLVLGASRAGVACVALIALSACGDSSSKPPSSSTAVVTTTAVTTTTAATTTTAVTTTTAAPTTATTTRAGTAAPAQVTVARAGPAGGSGEIEVVWGPVALATGYRVARATAPGGPFTTTADYDVATGTSVKAAGVTNVVFFSSSQTFQYVEIVSAVPADPHRYFRVTAYNAGGEGSPSAVVCGSPPGTPPC